MLSPINFYNFSKNITQFLGAKLPTTKIEEYISSHPEKIALYIDEIEIAIDCFNKFRKDQDFPNRKSYINAINLDLVYKQDLPKFAVVFKKLHNNVNFSNSVYSELGQDNYFQEVWEIRPISYLIVNLLLLIYRTSILQEHKDILIDKFGNRLVQISSTIEEMAYYQYLLGNSKNIFPALKIWLKKWQEEGFDQKLYTAVSRNNGEEQIRIN